MDNTRTYYQPAHGDTAATVAQGYDNNFQTLHEEVATGDAATLQSSNQYTASAVSGLIDSAPAALDTLRKMAAALGDDPNFATTIMQRLAEKLDTANYTAADVRAKLLTVDGRGSGIETDAIANQKTGSALKIWQGSEAEYNALAGKDPDTLYIVQ